MLEKLSTFAKSDNGKAVFAVSAALASAFELAETFVLIPQVSKEADGKMIFDLSPMNTHKKMSEFLEAISDKGTDLYLNRLLKVDNVFPFVYGTAFTLGMLRWSEKPDWKAALPLALMCFDLTENACSTKMLKDGEVSKPMALFASTMTNCKMTCMTGTLTLLGLQFLKTKK